MTNAAIHAQNLIRCRSVTPEEGGALRYLEQELSAAGFACHKLVFSEPGTPDVENLYARIGEGRPHICFAGHTDVVAPGDEASWTHPPFGGEIESGVLYGRGAVDMKGAVAASLSAVLEYLRAKPANFRGSISFLVTADEEGPAVNGTKKVVDWLSARAEQPDCCILGECTSEVFVGDTIKIGRRGSLSAQLRVRGVQGHSAYPQKSKNPLPPLIKALTLLKAKPLDEGSEHFQPSNLEITSIDTGNPTHNIIPAAASARFNIRFNDRHTGDSLKAWIEDQVRAAMSGTGIDYELSYEPVAGSFVTGPSGFVKWLSTAVRAETNQEPALSTAGGTSDARFIKDLCPVAELGLLNATAHKVNECVPLADLEMLTRIYLRFLHSTFGDTPLGTH
ncbi:MAG TPA: succinyl-diaminopimelate desuccinylase [Hyphomicrobiales bacterium]|nr:succinyl-diaminopimelate desuccinylase [Hyphomicrobiales bacterium]